MIKDKLAKIRAIASAISERWMFFTVLAIFLVLSFALIREIINRRQVDIRIDDYKQKIAALQQDNSALNDKIINFSSSGELEGSVRSKLGMEKPGEHTIIILRGDTQKKTTAIKSDQQIVMLDESLVEGQYQSNPQKWWNYFFKQ